MDSNESGQPTEEIATYTVTGMTCEHCVAAVRDEVGKLDGVTGVDVDLDSGRIVVTSTTRLGRAEVAAAVDDAGYELES